MRVFHLAARCEQVQPILTHLSHLGFRLNVFFASCRPKIALASLLPAKQPPPFVSHVVTNIQALVCFWIVRFVLQRATFGPVCYVCRRSNFLRLCNIRSSLSTFGLSRFHRRFNVFTITFPILFSSHPSTIIISIHLSTVIQVQVIPSQFTHACLSALAQLYPYRETTSVATVQHLYGDLLRGKHLPPC